MHSTKKMGLVTMFDESRFELVESHCFNPSNYITNSPKQTNINDRISYLMGAGNLAYNNTYNEILQDMKNRQHFTSVLKLRSKELQWASSNNNNTNNYRPKQIEFYVVNVNAPGVLKVPEIQKLYFDKMFEGVDEITNNDNDPLVFYCGDFNLSRDLNNDRAITIIEEYDLTDFTYGIGNTVNMITIQGHHILTQVEYIFSNKEIDNFLITKQFMSPETKTHAMPNIISPSGHAAIYSFF